MWDCNYASPGFKPCWGNYSYFHTKKSVLSICQLLSFYRKKGVQKGVQIEVQKESRWGSRWGPQGVQMGSKEGGVYVLYRPYLDHCGNEFVSLAHKQIIEQ